MPPHIPSLLAAALLLAPTTLAQEATNTPAATQPSVGKFSLRLKLQYARLGDDPSPEDREVDRVISTASLAYGVTPRLSLSLEVPVVYESIDAASSSDDGDDFGVEDFTLLAKWRLWQRDLGPVDSLRFALLGGVEIPSRDGDFSSDGVDPMMGGVFTAILGRHGLNQALRYKFTTDGDEAPLRPGDGQADALFFDTSYLFRLDPAQYGPDTAAATYLTLELNGLYETNGDTEILLGPGILYEARTFAAEVAVGLPIYQEVDERPEQDLLVTVGLRFLF